MTAAAALILYPSWAIAVLLAATAVRLGRATGLGLVAACVLLAAWITAVIFVELPGTRELAERIIPCGMLQAGAYVHAGNDILGRRSRLAALGYGWGAAVGVLGACWPRGLYGPAMVGAGPLFWPIAAASAVGAALVIAWLLHEARRRAGRERRQLIMLSVGNLFAITAGGGALLLRVIGVVHDLRLTAPALLGAVLVIGGAVIRGEVGPARRMIVQTLAYAAMAAVITAAGITALVWGMPTLAPGPAIGWTVFVALLAALPLDAVRALVVDAAGRRLFAAPIGVRDLAEQAERSETRADQAARLAELGTLVSAVAHEVRNPLGVIAAHAKLLERAGAPTASVDAVRAQVARASRFVDDLLAYGKPRPLAVRELVVRQLIDEAVAAVRASLGSDAAIEIAVAPATRATADRAGLHDILVNLIGNAVIAVGELRARPGQIVIAASAANGIDEPGTAGRGSGAGSERGGTDERDVVGRGSAAGSERGGIEISVTDNGPGVPDALAGRLFEPFATGRGRDHAHPGTGLGLAIARGIATRHGGTLHHERVAGGGARFVLRWPGGQ